jgi:hypothetical protein
MSISDSEVATLVLPHVHSADMEAEKVILGNCLTPELKTNTLNERSLGGATHSTFASVYREEHFGRNSADVFGTYVGPMPALPAGMQVIKPSALLS